MQFDQVVFYGRLGHQGLTMFKLDSAKLSNAWVDITAVDPLYSLSNTELKQRALANLDAAMATLSASQDIRPQFNRSLAVQLRAPIHWRPNEGTQPTRSNVMPADWQYDQGHAGCTDGLALHRASH